MAKLLAGKLKAMSGEYTPARKLVVGYFAPSTSRTNINLGITPVETLAQIRPQLTVEQVRTQLAGFGFFHRQATHQGRQTVRRRAGPADAGAGDPWTSPICLSWTSPPTYLDI